MKVIKSFPEDMDKRQKFAMMTSDNTKKMIDLKGVVINPDAWVLYEGEDRNGESIEILTISSDGELFATISQTFISKFKDIVGFFGNDVGEILIGTGTSKAGREYLTVDVSW